MIIGQGGSVRVFVATRPVDFRKGIDGLALAVQEMLGHDPFCGACVMLCVQKSRFNCIKMRLQEGTSSLMNCQRLESITSEHGPSRRTSVSAVAPANAPLLNTGSKYRFIKTNAAGEQCWGWLDRDRGDGDHPRY